MQRTKHRCCENRLTLAPLNFTMQYLGFSINNVTNPTWCSQVTDTNIPGHLKQMIQNLIQEESEREPGDTGPCMEYLLQVNKNIYCEVCQFYFLFFSVHVKTCLWLFLLLISVQHAKWLTNFEPMQLCNIQNIYSHWSRGWLLAST